MEGTHPAAARMGSRPFMPDPTLTCLCSALLGHIAKLGSITHPKQRRARTFEASLESVTAAAAEMAHNMPDDFRVSIPNASGEKAYLISSFR